MRCFAYGSNSNIRHLRKWIRSHGGDPAEIRHPQHGVLRGYCLRTNYLSAGHSAGAANIEPAVGQAVEGVVMYVTPVIRELLRRKEGWPHVYEEVIVTVETAESEQQLDAFTFVVADRHRLPFDLPVTPQYAGLILEAAAGFNFSALYQRRLRRVLRTVAAGTWCGTGSN
jgi:hypothetical protein